jgi:hypothetical protein
VFFSKKNPTTKADGGQVLIFQKKTFLLFVTGFTGWPLAIGCQPWPPRDGGRVIELIFFSKIGYRIEI